MENTLLKQLHMGTREFVSQFKRAMKAVLAEQGLTPLDGQIMLALKKGQAETKAQLAQHLHLKQAGLTRALDRLVEKKLILRQADPQDKRYVHLSLSEAGDAIGKKVRKGAHDIWRRLLVDCSESEIKNFVNMIYKMNVIFEE